MNVAYYKNEDNGVYNFYKNFADILVEGIKGISLSEKEIVKRYKFINPELAQAYYEKDKNIMIAGSHYANWEWGVLAGAPQINHHCIGLYKPLSNKLIDEHFKNNHFKSERANSKFFLAST